MIEFHNVHKVYDRWPILEDVSFRMDRGEFVFIAGPSGIGKSTLLRLIYMADFPNEGYVQVDQFRSDRIRRKEIPLLRRRIGMVFQDFKLLPDRNIFDNIAFALRVTGTKPKEIKRRTLQALTSVGLNHKRKALPFELSGGEQQRVALARALANEPFLLLADEPTGNLDAEAAADIYQLLNAVNSRGTAVLTITHDDGWAERLHHRILHLRDRKLVE